MASTLTTLAQSAYSYLSTSLEDFIITILKHGAIPRHVAFIMDGNRRYARKLGVQTGVGHYRGFDKLEEMLELCLKLGVETVTVYAFSIENFKRSEEEVTLLMGLAKEKLTMLCDKSDLVRDYDVRIRILGDLSLLPSDVREVMDHAMEMTASHKRALLNVCFPYTSRDELRLAVSRVVKGVHSGQIQLDDVDEVTLESCLMTAGSPDLDLLIRTSGEVRLSDFLLWQASAPGCQVHFIDAFWPEFSKRQMLMILLSYQTSQHRLEEERKWSREDRKWREFEDEIRRCGGDVETAKLTLERKEERVRTFAESLR